MEPCHVGHACNHTVARTVANCMLHARVLHVAHFSRSMLHMACRPLPLQSRNAPDCRKHTELPDATVLRPLPECRVGTRQYATHSHGQVLTFRARSIATEYVQSTI